MTTEKKTSQIEEEEVVEEQLQETPVKKPFLKRRWVRVCGVCFILFVLLFVFGVPLGAKYYLVDWLKKNGADHASIEKLAWNPFTGQLWLDGVDLSRDGKVLMKQADLSVDMELSSLFSKNIDLSSLTYRGLMLELEQMKDGGWKIATVTLPPGEEESSQKTVKVEGTVDAKGKTVQEQASSAWAFLANDVKIENCLVHYKSPILDLSVKIDNAEINKFSTRDGSQGGTLVLHGSVNGEPLSIDLSNVQVAPVLKLAGKIDISRFNLDNLDTILKEALPYFGGDAAVKGGVDFSMKDGEIAVDYDGSVEVQKADVGSESFRTRADRLNYTGKVHFAMPDKTPMTVNTDGVLQADGYSLQVPGAQLDTREKLVKLSGVTQVSIGDGVVVDNNGALSIDSIEFKMPMLNTNSDSFSWNGKVQYDLARHNLVDTDGTLKLKHIQYAMPDSGMLVANDDFSWQGKVFYQGLRNGDSNVVDTDGKLVIKPALFEVGQQGSKTRVDTENLSYDGTFSFAQPKAGGNRLGVNGVVNGEDTQVKLESAGITLNQKSLDLTSNSSLLLGDKIDVKSESSLDSGQFAMTLKGDSKPMLTVKSLKLDRLSGKGGANVSVENIVVADLLTEVKGQMPLQISTPEIRMNKVSTTDLEHFKARQLELSSPLIYAQHSKTDMLSLHDITFAGISASAAGDAAVDHLDFNKLVFLAPPKGNSENPVLSLGQAKLSGIVWSNKDGFNGKTLDFVDLVTDIVRDKKGVINISERLAAMQKDSEKKAAATVAGKDKKSAKKSTGKGKKGEGIDLPVPIRLGEVLITGKSGASFIDESLDVPFQTDLAIEKFRLSQFDSRKPTEKTAVFLAGTMEKRAPLKITGDVEPLLKNIGINLKVDLKNYPLRNLSPYVIQAIGTGLAAGELFVNTDMKLNDNYLKMDNQVILKKLETKMISKDLADKLSNKLPVPLDTALSILRDSEDNIDLSVPLHGELGSLHIGLGDVIVTALSKAVVPALAGYAVYALGPYGALAYVGMKMGQDLLKEGSTPVIFLQGATDLVPEQKKELDQVAEKMKKSKDDMQICPIVASWEFMTKVQIDAVKGDTVSATEADHSRLDALGQTRAKNVQEYLAKIRGIDMDRLLLCTTVIKDDKKMLPLVVLHK